MRGCFVHRQSFNDQIDLMERDFQGRGSLNSVFDFRDNEKVHQDRFHA
ncbi:hypothetical protein LPIBR_20317 [Lacticaseibacillus paracasei]|nr:hypothetical protein LPIBR_20317 [Lacticaseibacillus paracasei]